MQGIKRLKNVARIIIFQPVGRFRLSWSSKGFPKKKTVIKNDDISKLIFTKNSIFLMNVTSMTKQSVRFGHVFFNK